MMEVDGRTGQLPLDLFLIWDDCVSGKTTTSFTWNLGRAIEGYRKCEVLNFAVNTTYFTNPGPATDFLYFALQIMEFGSSSALQTSSDYNGSTTKTISPSFIIPNCEVINSDGYGGDRGSKPVAQMTLSGETISSLTCHLSDQSLKTLAAAGSPTGTFYLYMTLRFYE